MSDEDPPLTPEEEARVRRLLAEARVDPGSEALPDEVADRLDAVLVGLVEPGAQSADPSTSAAAAGSVADLATRRRRRVGGLLLAAAAVVVAAVGVGQVVDLGTGSSNDAGSTAAVDSGEGADRGEAAGSAGSGDGELREDAPAPAEAEPRSLGADGNRLPSATTAAVVRVRVRVAEFSDDAALVRRALGPSPPRDEFVEPSPADLPSQLRTRRTFDCAATTLDSGTWVPIVYHGSPAVLVLRRPAGDAQVAEVVQCGSGEILRSSTLPARAGR